LSVEVETTARHETAFTITLTSHRRFGNPLGARLAKPYDGAVAS